MNLMNAQHLMRLRKLCILLERDVKVTLTVNICLTAQMMNENVLFDALHGHSGDVMLILAFVHLILIYNSRLMYFSRFKGEVSTKSWVLMSCNCETNSRIRLRTLNKMH